jgi:DNA-binding response OmpR family regulator
MDPAPEKKAVLLVEDDKSIRELYAFALTHEGIEVLLADDGAQGLQMALAERPSVILLDINLPVMDGHKVAEKIRFDRWGKTVPIIFLTNQSDAANVAHAHMLNPDDYVVKANIPVKEVINKVRIAMHRQ